MTRIVVELPSITKKILWPQWLTGITSNFQSHIIKNCYGFPYVKILINTIGKHKRKTNGVVFIYTNDLMSLVS